MALANIHENKSLKVGLVTIGQSPRMDIVPEIERLISKNNGAQIELIEVGALDGLKLREVQSLGPRKSDETLVTRMSDGTEVIVGKSQIIPRMQDKVTELNRTDAQLVALLCSGSFPQVQSTVPLVKSDKLVKGILSSILLTGKLGVLVPSEAQVHPVSQELKELGYDTIISSASPYSKNQDGIKEAAQKFNKENVDLILMHCFGYSLEMRNIVKEITKSPIILVRSLLARALSELFY